MVSARASSMSVRREIAARISSSYASRSMYASSDNPAASARFWRERWRPTRRSCNRRADPGGDMLPRAVRLTSLPMSCGRLARRLQHLERTASSAGAQTHASSVTSAPGSLHRLVRRRVSRGASTRALLAEPDLNTVQRDSLPQHKQPIATPLVDNSTREINESDDTVTLAERRSEVLAS